MSDGGSRPCPICFESVSDHWSTQKVYYHSEANHSWSNDTCDGHDICWHCLAKHVEIQVLSEGKCSVRCPGPRCQNHLLRKDCEYAMWGSTASTEVLETLDRVHGQFCQDRLKELVLGTFSGKSETWLLRKCQPCPQCFVLAHREDGCDHIVCRCGCDFCFGCGAPSCDVCLCDSLLDDCRSGGVFFAAWLRSSYDSPCDWLWPLWEKAAPEGGSNGPSEVIPTLGFWLWLAGAEIPIVWEEADEQVEKKTQPVLPALKWAFSEDSDSDSDLETRVWDSEFEDDMRNWDTQVAGHLRKEAYSCQTHRSLRRKRVARRTITNKSSAEEDTRF